MKNWRHFLHWWACVTTQLEGTVRSRLKRRALEPIGESAEGPSFKTSGTAVWPVKQAWSWSTWGVVVIWRPVKAYSWEGSGSGLEQFVLGHVENCVEVTLCDPVWLWSLWRGVLLLLWARPRRLSWGVESELTQVTTWLLSALSAWVGEFALQ